MSKIVDLACKRAGIRKKREEKYVHAQASYAILDNCLKYLNMNNLEELKDIKKQIMKTMKKLKEISINGR